MTDIVDWLRAYANRTTVINIKRLDEAADEIERLREWNAEIALNAREFVAENEKLRAALEKICNGPRDADLDYLDLFVEVKMEARAALDGQSAPSEWRPDALVTAANALIDFYNGPIEAKRPDIFQRLMQRLADALPPRAALEGRT